MYMYMYVHVHYFTFFAVSSIEPVYKRLPFAGWSGAVQSEAQVAPALAQQLQHIQRLAWIETHAYSTRQKNLSELAQSTVAAVHINSRITLRMPMHVDRVVLAQPSVYKERRATKAWCVVQE